MEEGMEEALRQGKDELHRPDLLDREIREARKL
jgi:hypothetical protein